MNATITLVANDTERMVKAETGERLSAALCRCGTCIDMPCGGRGICKKCEVRINGKKHLACQTSVKDGMYVELDSPADFKNISSGDTIEILPKNPMYSSYGVSIDLGTTTVCASLLGASGTVQTVTCKNPQAIFGSDVISRIEKALSGGTKELADCVRGVFGEMVTELCDHKGIKPEMIDAAVITGNTAMLYLLTEQNPETLSHAPFRADRLFGEYMDAKKLGLAISPCARIYLPRCASAFVGGDVTTAIIASGMCDQKETAILIDIGTNGEIALWHEGKLTCCSTAAGPAFEGAGITCGQYGVNGAIDHVWHEKGQICCSTIGGAETVGICGSGIVDTLAVMLELGVIDETGAFVNGNDYFELQNGIGINKSDVRKIQLAKGSIRAGMETLLEVLAVGKSEVKILYIAGGFGSFVDLKNAAAIGLIPKELLPYTKVIGNAAHIGATMLLQDKALVSKELIERARTVAMDANPVFTNNFMIYMTFE